MLWPDIKFSSHALFAYLLSSSKIADAGIEPDNKAYETSQSTRTFSTALFHLHRPFVHSSFFIQSLLIAHCSMQTVNSSPGRIRTCLNPNFIQDSPTKEHSGVAIRDESVLNLALTAGSKRILRESNPSEPLDQRPTPDSYRDPVSIKTTRQTHLTQWLYAIDGLKQKTPGYWPGVSICNEFNSTYAYMFPGIRNSQACR